MNEREAILRAVCENPDDDTTRLIFADWLQENGDEPRAEYIRLQVLMAQVESRAESDWASWQRLCAQEQQLRLEHDERWWHELPESPDPRAYQLGRLFTRGFIESIFVTEWQPFARDVELILASSPIMRASFSCELDLTRPETLPILARFRELDVRSDNFTEEDWLTLIAADLPRLKKLVIGRPTIEWINHRFEARFGECLHRPYVDWKS